LPQKVYTVPEYGLTSMSQILLNLQLMFYLLQLGTVFAQFLLYLCLRLLKEDDSLLAFSMNLPEVLVRRNA